MDAMEFFIYAQNSIGQSEVANRNAASRAYYSAYHICLNHALEKGFDCSEYHGSFHAQLIQFYQSHPSRNYQAIGKILRRMRSTRIHADYFLDRPFTTHHVQTQLYEAQLLFNELARIQAA